MRYFLGIFLAFLLAGCGYKPISKITQDILGDPVYVDVVISKIEPKNSVWIKDALKEAMVSRLNKSLTDDKNAKTQVVVSINSLRYNASVYDEYGYITSYTAVLTLKFKTKFENGTSEDIVTSGEYDFSVARRSKSTRYADSIISDTERYNAVREASREAIDEYIATLAIKGYKNGSSKR